MMRGEYDMDACACNDCNDYNCPDRTLEPKECDRKTSHGNRKYTVGENMELLYFIVGKEPVPSLFYVHKPSAVVYKKTGYGQEVRRVGL